MTKVEKHQEETGGQKNVQMHEICANEAFHDRHREDTIFDGSQCECYEITLQEILPTTGLVQWYDVQNYPLPPYVSAATEVIFRNQSDYLTCFNQLFWVIGYGKIVKHAALTNS